MPRFLAVYTMKPEDVVRFRALPKAEQQAVDAEGLRQSLRDTLSQVNDVIAGLKQHHRQSKRLRTAVQSLKEFQAIGA